MTIATLPAPLLAAPLISDWIRFEQDRRVSVLSGRVERRIKQRYLLQGSGVVDIESLRRAPTQHGNKDDDKQPDHHVPDHLP